jgi:FlaA1/EpsC-like NDP-sugar epimerase
MRKRLIIVGAGEAGRMLAREVANRAQDQYEVAGFLDDAPALSGAMVDGFRVLGATRELPAVVGRERADEVLIAVPSARREFVRRMVALCRDASVPYRIAPGLLEIIKGPVHLEQIRDARPEDLLGRETVEFDEREIESFLAGRTVLVTGAGGSIGSEICRQVARFDVRRLVLLGRGENQIYDIEREMREAGVPRDVVPVIVDVRDAPALARVFAQHRPEIVYHAAAHKHVHYMEAFPSEAVKNNITGTVNVIDAARAAGTARVVMLSTDKAAEPRGVMGATKRVAEFLMAARNGPGGPRLITVRFGNVLASRGSVVPLFVAQIRAGGPVTVSHEEATRFFMSVKEACMLVVQASLMGEGGEIFILKMGEPIRIAELARPDRAARPPRGNRRAHRVHGPAAGREAAREPGGARRERGAVTPSSHPARRVADALRPGPRRGGRDAGPTGRGGRGRGDSRRAGAPHPRRRLSRHFRRRKGALSA